MGQGSRGSGWLLCVAGLSVACGETTKDDEQAGPAELPPFGATLSTSCDARGTDWLPLEEMLPGRWTYGGAYMDVGIDLEASWGQRLQSSDHEEGRSVWARDAEGLVEEVGAGPCSQGSECGARFVRRGTAAVNANNLTFYALWPLDPCQEGVAGRYEGRELFENNRSTGGELRIWSERSERLTLEADQTWLWSIEVITYASLNDMGSATWLAEPRIEHGQDRGTYEQLGNAVTFTRNEPASGLAWIPAEPGQAAELELVGRALPKPGVPRYGRTLP
jgi:hypothetical protein